jgi:hypothetical protein
MGEISNDIFSRHDPVPIKQPVLMIHPSAVNQSGVRFLKASHPPGAGKIQIKGKDIFGTDFTDGTVLPIISPKIEQPISGDRLSTGGGKKKLRKTFLARISRMALLKAIISPEIRSLISGDRLSAGSGKTIKGKDIFGTPDK